MLLHSLFRFVADHHGAADPGSTKKQQKQKTNPPTAKTKSTHARINRYPNFGTPIDGWRSGYRGRLTGFRQDLQGDELVLSHRDHRLRQAPSSEDTEETAVGPTSLPYFAKATKEPASQGELSAFGSQLF